jgi:surfeit locus 1 family protein
VPYDRKDPAARAQGQVKGEVTVTGLARDPLSEKPSFIVPENQPAKNMFYWKDLSAMAASAGLPADKVLPFFVDANNAPNPGGLPVGGVTLINLPNNHFQYALTWYGLALVLLVVVAIRLRERWRGPREEGRP